MDKKYLIFGVIILMFIGLISYILIAEFIPPINQYKEITLSGKVLSVQDAVGVQPSYVYVYYPYYAPKFICRGDSIKLASVDNTGNFEVSFQVPLGLNEVTLTTDCASCNFTIINLNNIPNYITVYSGDLKCDSELRLDNNTDKMMDDLRQSLSYFESNIPSKNFNQSQLYAIREDVERARREIGDAESSKEKNQSLLHTYYAEWFAWNAYYKSNLFDLEQCVMKTDSLLKNKANDTCFVPNYESYMTFSTANTTFFSLSKGKTYPYDYTDIDRVKREIDYVHRQAGLVSDTTRNCENALDMINNTFEFQKPYCEKRRISINILNWSFLIIFLIVGLILGKFGRRWMEK